MIDRVTPSRSRTSGASPWSLAAFTAAGYDKGRSVLWQALWFAVMNLVFYQWWCPRTFRVTLLRWFGASVADGVFIRHRVRILWPWKLAIGENTWIGEDVWILNLERVSLGADVCLSQGAFLCTGSHDMFSPSFEYANGPIDVESGVWIAAQALVLRGVRISSGSVVGARGIVTRDLPADSFVRAGERA